MHLNWCQVSNPEVRAKGRKKKEETGAEDWYHQGEEGVHEDTYQQRFADGSGDKKSVVICNSRHGTSRVNGTMGRRYEGCVAQTCVEKLLCGSWQVLRFDDGRMTQYEVFSLRRHQTYIDEACQRCSWQK